MTRESTVKGTESNSNGFLSPNANKMDTHSRSSSVASSARSSISRMTRVGDEPEFIKEFGPKIDATYDRTVLYTRVYSWLDHLLEVFFIHREGKIVPIVEENFSQSDDSEGLQDSPDGSPWVQPVCVLSTRRDTDKNEVAKLAKCTIDTGNMQGNIVSRDFVTDVLGYSESNFMKITKQEERGGTGVTGHKLVPTGAIYLTWWHSKSSRVFHNMRFLVSEYPMYDLIIGAASIQEYGILDVPNLITANVGGPDDSEVGKLRAEQHQKDRAMAEAKKEMKKAKPDDDSAQNIKDLTEAFIAKEKEYKIVTAKLEHYKAKVAGNKELEIKYKEEIEELTGVEFLPSRSATEASGVSQHDKANGETKKRGLSGLLPKKSSAPKAV